MGVQLFIPWKTGKPKFSREEGRAKLFHGAHARIQEFSSGGGEGPGQPDKKSSDKFFFSPQLILLKSNS